MTRYIKNFVTGYGVNFETSKRNFEAFSKASTKWKEISSNLRVNGDSVILFCGAKNNGKSSLVRYVLNEYNQNRDCNGEQCSIEIPQMDSTEPNTRPSKPLDSYAYYIDYDPGQPEMTTPGLVSAHIIKSNAQPLESPSYLNVLQHEPIVMSSVGGTNMSVNPQMFIENCRYVYSRVIEHQSKSVKKRPIFINTMGHIRNVGLAMLMDLIKICSPTNLVILNVENDPMRIIYADLSPESIMNTRASFYYDITDQSKKLDYKCDIYNLEFSFVDSAIVSTKNRTASQLAYLSSIPEALYKPIMQLSSRWLSLETVSIFCVSSYPLRENIVLELLYHSWIHLVKIRKPLILDRNKGKDSEGCKVVCNIIDDVGENVMFGCGIVADIDLERKKLFIITPLSQDALNQNINCVIKPLSIQVPRENNSSICFAH